jgi:(2Fe-2S) ferredoxin
MNKTQIPYKKMIFVCTNTRDEEGRVACANAGRVGVEICEKLKAAVKERGLTGRVRVTRSGCQDLCEKGPVVAVFPDHISHQHVSLQDIPELIKQYLDPLAPPSPR